MVLGEPQILGQMKQAVRTAEAAGSLGLVLGRLFQRTFAVAKDVRTQTDIGSASISMAAASVKLAERIFPSIAEQRLLLIGAGEMIELAATHFCAKSPKSVTVANRTLERGRQLADRFGADAITLNELPDRLREFDIIVTCTASTLPILGKGILERVIRQRKHAPIFIVDLAVPRDVEPEAGELDDVFLYTVDDLAAIVKDNLQIRREAVVQAEQMIADQTGHFLRWLEGRNVVPTIAALHEHHDHLRSTELDRARKMLAGGTAPDKVLEALARAITNKLLHGPLAGAQLRRRGRARGDDRRAPACLPSRRRPRRPPGQRALAAPSPRRSRAATARFASRGERLATATSGRRRRAVRCPPTRIPGKACMPCPPSGTSRTAADRP